MSTNREHRIIRVSKELIISTFSQNETLRTRILNPLPDDAEIVSVVEESQYGFALPVIALKIASTKWKDGQPDYSDYTLIFQSLHDEHASAN